MTIAESRNDIDILSKSAANEPPPSSRPGAPCCVEAEEVTLVTSVATVALAAAALPPSPVDAATAHDALTGSFTDLEDDDDDKLTAVIVATDPLLPPPKDRLIAVSRNDDDVKSASTSAAVSERPSSRPVSLPACAPNRVDAGALVAPALAPLAADANDGRAATPKSGVTADDAHAPSWL
jgi:hypothetical protein